jgi:iron complex outermembrane receptor protein
MASGELRNARARWAIAVIGLAFVSGTPALAQSSSPIQQVEVTATRLPEPVANVPADISLVWGDDLRARGAHDLASALALVPGIEAPSGGDAGPESAVPSFWGLHEFDAFLLVVDGVPWGGAFNPVISTLDLTDVSRVEVLKGSAPVMYGATSFVGVVQVLHYSAGEAANVIEAGGGNRNSWRGSASFVLPEFGDWRQSLAADGETLGFADAREKVRSGRLLYRGSGALGPGTFRIDADVALNDDVPPSPVVRQGGALTTLTPHNANYNPANAGITEHRYHLTLGYTQDTSAGAWDTTLSFAHSDIRDVRGFLRDDLTNTGAENADSQDQHRFIHDLYFDTHVGGEISDHADYVVGADLLYGLGRQRSLNGAYFVPLSGMVAAPSTTSLHVDEINTIADRRLFAGQYGQIDWKPSERLDVVIGLRLNETSERKRSTHIDGFDPSADEAARESHSQMRLSGTVGASYRLWQDGADQAILYADYRNAFKPGAIDFGPDYTPDILNPETAQSYEAGLKGALDSGRFAYQAEVFLLDFNNLVVATTDSSGDPVLRNAGGERLKGAEFDARYQLGEDFALDANIAYHDARFTHFSIDDGSGPVDVSGNQLTLAPHVLASAGLLYTPEQGFKATLVARYVGKRYFDEENTASASSYVTLDATLGYRLGRYELALEGTNLTNRRPPVSQSEFGSSSFYLLPAASWFLTLRAHL